MELPLLMEIHCAWVLSMCRGHERFVAPRSATTRQIMCCAQTVMPRHIDKTHAQCISIRQGSFIVAKPRSMVIRPLLLRQPSASIPVSALTSAVFP